MSVKITSGYCSSLSLDPFPTLSDPDPKPPSSPSPVVRERENPRCSYYFRSDFVGRLFPKIIPICVAGVFFLLCSYP
jgi:hypothetical protein